MHIYYTTQETFQIVDNIPYQKLYHSILLFCWYLGKSYMQNLESLHINTLYSSRK